MPALAFVVISFRALWGCFRRRNDEIGASNEVTRPEVQIWRDTFIAAMVLYPQVRRAFTSPARLRVYVLLELRWLIHTIRLQLRVSRVPADLFGNSFRLALSTARRGLFSADGRLLGCVLWWHG